MKKIVIIMLGLSMALTSSAQKVRGSVQQGSATNKVNVVYLPDHDRSTGYANYLAVSIAIPTSVATGVVPTIVSAGPFSPLSFVDAGSYTIGSETIYSWVAPTITPYSMSWTSGTAFVGAIITFQGSAATSKVKLVDFTSNGGGDNGATNFNVSINVAPFDLVDAAAMFYSINPSSNGSSLGTYPPNAFPLPNGDQFVQTDLLISLPVNMLNFSGYKNGGKNTLRWTVASEVNNKGFDVQRSTDGSHYTSIGFVNSQVPGGFTNAEVSYAFDDNNPAAVKKQYYRLNQLDIDGRSKLSNIVMITGDKPNTLGIGGLFPNPASTQINVLIDAPRRDNVTLVITDMGGKTVKQELASVETGSNTVQVDIANLASGSYLVKVLCKSSDCETAVAKFNKQ